MQLVLEKRAERSPTIALVSPLIAIGLTIVTMTILFAVIGKNPAAALFAYFIAPLTDGYSLQEIAVKAKPLVLIAVGLSLCYLANAWNIGAEGQFLIGAVAGSWLAVKTQGTDAGAWVLPVMLLLATIAGALYALYAPSRDMPLPVGEFNHARIVVNHGKVQHWLNGVKVVEYEIGSPDFKARVAASKFKRWPQFASGKTGSIALQNHGSEVWFQNIKIKILR